MEGQPPLGRMRHNAGSFRSHRVRFVGHRRDDRRKLGLHALEAHEAEDQAQLVQDLNGQSHAAAERAGDEKGAALVAPPAFAERNGGVEIAAAQQRGARAKAGSHRRMQRAEAQLPLDPELERVDCGRLIECSGDLL